MSKESYNSTDDARNAWNLQLEEFNLRMHLQQNNMSPNDYFWQPCFNDVIFQDRTLEEDTDRPQSTPAISDRAQSTPAITECPPSNEIDIKKFPNPRSERIYHYVVDVLDCYERRKTEYVQNRVFPHLESYRDKANAVQVAIVGNDLGIRDEFSECDLEQIDSEIDNLSSNVTDLLIKFTEEWIRCNKISDFLKEIKTKMLDYCFDRETLRLAKHMAMKLVASLKKAHEIFYACLNKVKEFYVFLNNIQDALF